MDKFTRHEGVVAPLLRNNIDTDAIIPSREMKRVSKHGLSDGLFSGWRYLDPDLRDPNPEFVLNQPRYRGASILLAGENFGCGSSREHAVWALKEFGIRAILAPSFGAIFFGNCIANGILPVRLDWQWIRGLAERIESAPEALKLVVDLEQRVVRTSGGEGRGFEIMDSHRQMLLNGWDPIDLTLQLDDRIAEFCDMDRRARPWIYREGP